MSVTVEQLMLLPSLREAQVVAGHGGMSRIVSSISVLESCDPGVLNDSIFHNDEFYGSEIVITGFINASSNVKLQCKNISRLAEGGEAGLILFYVGAFMKEISPELCTLADELNFPIICMPKGRVDLRYSDVIYDVMDAIIRSQAQIDSLVVELLDHVSSLPQHQQNMSTVVKMLSDRTRATIILTDTHRNVLNEASWPRTLDGLYKNLWHLSLPESGDYPVPFPQVPDSYLYHAEITSEEKELYLVRQPEPLAGGVFQQCVEVIRLASRIWSKRQDADLISELVIAILQDEPQKMRRLAEMFQIDIAAISTMLIISTPGRESVSPKLLEEVRSLARPYCKTSFADIFEGQILLFMDSTPTLEEITALWEEILLASAAGTVLTLFSNLQDTSDVRSAFLLNKLHIADARAIFPHRSRYTGGDLSYSQHCRSIVAGGEDAVARATKPLLALQNARDGGELVETLSVYLLDTDMSMSQTAERLFLHKNTIKYRLKCISELLGFRVGSMPSTGDLYISVGVNRIIMA